ncbi:glutamic acid-rich protein-like isoform X3 [Haliotis rubra]|uniref:glutamic acid-rich protein-like isoform X3 n=1 Tax=Haliotis rubra TaxID=36100 RepID=UPI001EE5B654|nr:glutamic acid-rich protein-like isoform X3 [Haliotis rubra]
MTLQVLLSVLLLSVGLARSGSYVKRDVSEITKDVLQGPSAAVIANPELTEESEESAESPETTEESDENDEESSQSTEEEDDDDDNDSDDDEEESESAEENGNKEEESSSESSPSHRNRQKKMRANKRYLNRGLNTSETSLYQEDQTLI